jgi:hypothetical protein
LPSIEHKLAQHRRPKQRGIATHLHVDNIRAHTAKSQFKELKNRASSARLTRPSIPLPLFIRLLQRKLKGMQFVNEDHVIPAVTQVPEELPTEMLLKVMDDWAKQ